MRQLDPSRRTRRTRIVGGGLAIALVLGACADDGGDTSTDTDGTTPQTDGEATADDGTAAGDGEYESLTVAWSTEAAAYVPQSQGPWRMGEDFGLAQEEGDITELSSHATAVQLLLSGRADVATGSFSAMVQTIQQGQDLKLFCPIQGDLTDDFVGTGDVTELEQITDPSVSVAIDSPGGLINHVLNHVFEARGLGITTAELENVQIIEDGGLRLAALASGDADAAVLDPFEKAELVSQLGEEQVHTLSTVAEDMDTVGFVYASTSEWLEENQDRAAAFCASVLGANRTLAENFDMYVEWTNHAMNPAPEEAVLEENWNRAREYGVWPFNDDLLAEEIVTNDLELSVRSEMLEETALDLSYEDLVDPRPAAAAVELLGGRLEPSDLTGS